MPWSWTRTRRFQTTFDLLEPASAADAVAAFEQRNPGWAVVVPAFPIEIGGEDTVPAGSRTAYPIVTASVHHNAWPERMAVDGQIVYRWTFLVEEKVSP